MNKKMSKRQKDIKSKLMAAIAMLLVSSIMMVSTTYAWFTLSTAPEVTGISTAVGANGNLEMALLNPELQDETTKALISNWGDTITSGTSDSMDAAGTTKEQANITWGNLVDVSNDTAYGLNNISLYPAALTATADGKIAERPLSRPVYGADGRMAELKADTLTASYVSGKFSNEDAFGVRAVGTASSMTARELAHRAAMSSASTASNDAKSAASGTLITNGNVLAGIAITHVGDASKTFTYNQVNTLKTVVTDMQGAHNDIADAMKWYVVAHNIAPEGVTDDTYLGIQEAIMGMSLAELNDSEYSKPDGFAAAYAALTTSQGKITTALDVLNTALAGKTESSSDIAWTDFDDALNAIMDYNSMKLNGLAMNEVKETDGEGNFVNATVIINAMSKEGLQLQMPTGSGVFADIADFCGTYSATIIFPEGTFVMGVGIGGVEARMITSAPINPTYLATVREETAAFGGSDAGAAKSITDYYGYIIDLGFRTNAAGSNLLLQAEAIDRIYGEEGNNADVMGHGSTMTFTTADPTNFSVPKMQSLMSNLRIIFFETDTKTILGEARLNPATESTEGNTSTMKMAMWDPSDDDDASTVPGFKTGDDANVITALTQNTAKAISVLVYLDGESVTNASVAATGTQSMTGTMNLQFASDADLAPMNYAELKDGKGTTVEPTKETLTNVSFNAGETGVSMVSAVLADGKIGVVLNGYTNQTVTVKVGEGEAQTVVPTTLEGVTGVYVNAPADFVANTTDVVVTVTAAG